MKQSFNLLKKILSMILAIIMVASLFTVCAIPANAAANPHATNTKKVIKYSIKPAIKAPNMSILLLSQFTIYYDNLSKNNRQE